MSATTIRPPAVAGQFYTDDPAALRAQIQDFADRSGVNPARNDVAAILVPHAGYPYSGYTAACAYARAVECPIRRVVLLGVSHHHRFKGASLPDCDAFETPLGQLPVDTELCELLRTETITANIDAHGPEHALEVQLPFIQVLLPEVTILPILFGAPFSSDHEAFAQALARHLDGGDLVVISTDLSHYLIERQANQIDRRSIDTLLKRKPNLLLDEIEEGHCSMCSATAVAIGMEYANLRGADNWQLLDYRTSADASGDTSRVVGYASVSMEFAA